MGMEGRVLRGFRNVSKGSVACVQVLCPVIMRYIF